MAEKAVPSLLASLAPCEVAFMLGKVPAGAGLNEEEEGSCRGVLKSYTERLEREPHCSSDPDDGELIIHVPFGEAVKMKFLSLTGGDGGTMVMVCGRDGFVGAWAGVKVKKQQGAVRGALKELGYTDSEVYRY